MRWFYCFASLSTVVILTNASQMYWPYRSKLTHLGVVSNRKITENSGFSRRKLQKTLPVGTSFYFLPVRLLTTWQMSSVILSQQNGMNDNKVAIGPLNCALYRYIWFISSDIIQCFMDGAGDITSYLIFTLVILWIICKSLFRTCRHLRSIYIMQTVGS